MRRNTYFVVWAVIGVGAGAGGWYTMIYGPTDLWIGFMLVGTIAAIALTMDKPE